MNLSCSRFPSSRGSRSRCRTLGFLHRPRSLANSEALGVDVASLDHDSVVENRGLALLQFRGVDAVRFEEFKQRVEDFVFEQLAVKIAIHLLEVVAVCAAAQHLAKTGLS